MAYTTECASREYFDRTHIPEILQAISCGLAYCKPDDVLEFMEDCIRQIREKNMLNTHIPWDAFIPKGVLRPVFGLGKFSSLLPPIQNMKTITPIPLLSSIPKNNEIPLQDDIFSTENMKFKNYLDPIPQVAQQKYNRKGKKWKNVIFVIGGPCSGVTTQCKNLSENLNYEHISIAEIVNSFAQKNDSRAKLIKELYDEANVLPINFIIEELKNVMDKGDDDNRQGILIDGFPEYLDQAILFEKNIINCKKVLYLVCSEKELNIDTYESRYILVNDLEDKEKIKAIHISANKADLAKKITKLDKYRLTSITPLPISISNLLEFTSTENKENLMIVNIEETTTVTTIIEQKIYDIKKVEQGIGEIIKRVKEKEISELKAYEIVKNSTIYTNDSMDLEYEETNYLDEIMPTIYNIVGTLKKITNESVNKIDKIYITGTAALINNIDIYFQDYRGY